MNRPTSQDLQSLPLFGGINASGLGCLVDRCDVVELAAGEVLFREGDPARTLYVVQSGQLVIVKARGDGEVVLWSVEPGDHIGEMSFIDMQPRSATARATTKTTLWAWSYAAIHERYCADSKCAMLIVMNMARELSRRLRKADELIAQTRAASGPVPIARAQGQADRG